MYRKILAPCSQRWNSQNSDLFFLGKVEVVDSYERIIRSVSLAIRVPAVVRLLRYIHLGKRRPPLTRINVLARDSFKCQYCGRSPQNTEKLILQICHIIPPSKNGNNDPQNLITTCIECNIGKTDILLN